MTTTEQPTEQEFNVRIARGLLIFPLALIAMIVTAIVEGFHWRSWVELAIAIFAFLHMFRAAFKSNELHGSPRKKEKQKDESES